MSPGHCAMNGLQPEAGLPTGDDEVLRLYAFWPEASELMAAAEMAMVGLPLFSRGCTERSMSMPGSARGQAQLVSGASSSG
jgi:hypothetical protein